MKDSLELCQGLGKFDFSRMSDWDSCRFSRCRSKMTLKQLRQVEEMMNDRFHRALADYEQKAGPEDSDLGSSDETSSESG